MRGRLQPSPQVLRHFAAAFDQLSATATDAEVLRVQPLLNGGGGIEAVDWFWHLAAVSTTGAGRHDGRPRADEASALAHRWGVFALPSHPVRCRISR